jgi:mono/diheme cytochrome c family protein
MSQSGCERAPEWPKRAYRRAVLQVPPGRVPEEGARSHRDREGLCEPCSASRRPPCSALPRIRSRQGKLVNGLLTSLLLLTVCGSAAQAGDAAHGQVLFALAGGCGCHTPDSGPVGAGGREIKTPFGTFYGPNITPDRDTGVGDWSDKELIAAIRDGKSRLGVESPVMPYYQYAGMTDGDAGDLVAYLRTLAPVRRENTPSAVTIPMPRLAYRSWRLLFASRAARPANVPSEPVARGRYLVQSVAVCTDCHTPRTSVGAPNRKLYLAGTNDGPDGESVPNITPDSETGIGDWSETHIVHLLQSGMKPDGDDVEGLMAQVIKGVGGGPGFASAPESELHAIAAYLKTVPPIRHEIGG